MRDDAAQPDHPAPCPVCGYDLRGTIASGARLCPECAHTLSDRDVVMLATPPNVRGEPSRMKPGEPRISGRTLLVIALAFILLLMVALLLIIRLSPTE